MSDKHYTEEFKIKAIKQVTERVHSVQDVAHRLGVSTHSLYVWLKKYGHGHNIPPTLMTSKPRSNACVPS